MRKTRIPAIAAAAAIVLIPAAASSQKSHDAAVARNLTTFNALVKELELNYVDTIRTDEAFKTAIGAMLSTVDPYTEYYTSEDQEALNTMTTGEYGGIGSYILERDGFTYISEPYEGSPASLAGLKAGDKILRVDTTDTSKPGVKDVTKLLKGQPGTTVRVTVQRPHVADSILTVDIERRKLTLPSVPYYDTIGHTGYISLTSFMEKSPEEVRTALLEFKDNPDVHNVVLDLRGNGGGLLESAVEIVGMFVPKGTEVLRTKGRDLSTEKTYKTTKAPIMPDIPLAVLIDGGSASASEITAGALQDLDRAVLIGTRSFGKGLVQSVRPLPYDGLLKVTVAKYYIPSGRLIQALDYSHRNPDGTVARTPDSLTNVYHTAGGREVRDGGGLTPDVTVEWDRMSTLVYSLLRDHKMFDFATEYAATHPSIGDPKLFRITDEDFRRFKASVDTTDFKYDKVCAELIKSLRTTAKNEGYLDNDSASAAIDRLERLLTPELGSDIDRKRREITAEIEEEILTRYYFSRGKMIGRLRNDPGLDKAIAILSDSAELKKILGH